MKEETKVGVTQDKERSCYSHSKGEKGGPSRATIESFQRLLCVVPYVGLALPLNC